MKSIAAVIVVSSLILLGCGDQSSSVAAEQERMSPVSKDVPVLVQPDGSYPTVPLEKDTVVLKVIQTTTNSLKDFPSIQEGLDHNLKHMEAMADKACTTGKKPDFLLFHEFPLTGFSAGRREEKLKYTIKIPGPETERLGKVAKACDAYLIFGTYASDDEWPNHILSINAVMGRDGTLKKAFWKSRNIKNYKPTVEIETTTVENVRDRYREKYGIEEEFPVLQTEFGNIAVSTVQWDPFVFAAFAMKGTEIMVRTATLFMEIDVAATANMNDFYSTMTNIAFDIPGYSAGESIIVDNKGKIIAKSESKTEDDIIEAEIPIAEFRKNRTIPSFALDLAMPVISQYKQPFPLNHLDLPPGELPQTGEEMKELMDSVSVYKKK